MDVPTAPRARPTPATLAELHLKGPQAGAARGSIARDKERDELWNSVRDTLGTRPQDRLIEVIDLGDGDVVVHAEHYGTTGWAAMPNGTKPQQWYQSRDWALLHLLAQKHDGARSGAHLFACRVLNMPREN